VELVVAEGGLKLLTEVGEITQSDVLLASEESLAYLVIGILEILLAC
jgi:hypothetical protein